MQFSQVLEVLPTTKRSDPKIRVEGGDITDFAKVLAAEVATDLSSNDVPEAPVVAVGNDTSEEADTLALPGHIGAEAPLRSPGSLESRVVPDATLFQSFAGTASLPLPALPTVDTRLTIPPEATPTTAVGTLASNNKSQAVEHNIFSAPESRQEPEREISSDHAELVQMLPYVAPPKPEIRIATTPVPAQQMVDETPPVLRPVAPGPAFTGNFSSVTATPLPAHPVEPTVQSGGLGETVLPAKIRPTRIAETPANHPRLETELARPHEEGDAPIRLQPTAQIPVAPSADHNHLLEPAPVERFPLSPPTDDKKSARHSETDRQMLRPLVGLPSAESPKKEMAQPSAPDIRSNIAGTARPETVRTVPIESTSNAEVKIPDGPHAPTQPDAARSNAISPNHIGVRDPARTHEPVSPNVTVASVPIPKAERQSGGPQDTPRPDQITKVLPQSTLAAREMVRRPVPRINTSQARISQNTAHLAVSAERNAPAPQILKTNGDIDVPSSRVLVPELTAKPRTESTESPKLERNPAPGKPAEMVVAGRANQTNGKGHSHFQVDLNRETDKPQPTEPQMPATNALRAATQDSPPNGRFRVPDDTRDSLTTKSSADLKGLAPGNPGRAEEIAQPLPNRHFAAMPPEPQGHRESVTLAQRSHIAPGPLASRADAMDLRTHSDGHVSKVSFGPSHSGMPTITVESRRDEVHIRFATPSDTNTEHLRSHDGQLRQELHRSGIHHFALSYSDRENRTLYRPPGNPHGTIENSEAEDAPPRRAATDGPLSSPDRGLNLIY